MNSIWNENLKGNDYIKNIPLNKHPFPLTLSFYSFHHVSVSFYTVVDLIAFIDWVCVQNTFVASNIWKGAMPFARSDIRKTWDFWQMAIKLFICHLSLGYNNVCYSWYKIHVRSANWLFQTIYDLTPKRRVHHI